MVLRRGVSLLCLLFTVAPASAEWAPSARKDFLSLERKMASRTNGQMAGISGSATVYAGAVLRSCRFRRITFKEKIEYLVSRTGRTISPLVVFFPGIFGDATSSGGLMVARQIRRSRNHVLILPNPWGENFQSARPRFMPGDFEREAKAMTEIIESGIDFIGRGRISEIHFIGESYGGFLAPATAHEMNRRGVHHVKSVNSVAVPFHVGNAIEAIDRMADENENAYFEGGCRRLFTDLFRLVGFIFELVAHPGRNEIYGKECVACSSAIFSFQAFQQPLFELGKDINGSRPSPIWSSKPESYWERKMRFRDLGEIFFDISAEEVLNRESARLVHWVNLLRRAGTETLALVSKDDPLNPPPGVGSYEVIPPYEREEILVLTRGGHLGIRGTRDYRRLLRHQYRLSPAMTESEVLPDDALDDDFSPAADGLDVESDSEFNRDEF